MGKTVLAKFLAYTFESDSITKRNIFYYFCSSQDKSRNDANSLLKAIIHQSLQQAPYLLRRHVSLDFQAHGDKICDSFGLLWKIFVSIVRDPDLGDTICILDALDECEEQSREEILKQLGSAFSSSSANQDTLKAPSEFKLIITSRPYESIRVRLFPFAIIRLRAEKEEDSINSDIARYVDNRVQKLADLRHYHDELQDSVHSALIKGADGMFLWVSLMIAILEKTPAKLVNDQIKTLPRGLDCVYNRVLDEIPEESREVAGNVLMWVTFASRPLKMKELGVACAINQDDGGCEAFSTILSNLNDGILGDVELCGPILKVQNDGSVHLVHQTTKEYLIQRLSSLQGTPRLPATETMAHLEIAIVCLTCLAFNELEYDIWSIVSEQDTKSTLPYMEIDLVLQELPFLGYAAMYWQDHARHLDPDNERLWTALKKGLSHQRRRNLITFIQDYLLNRWNSSYYDVSRSDQTPLHMLVHSRLKLFAERYATSEEFDPNAVDNRGTTVLHSASEYGYHTLACHLLSKKADVALQQEVYLPASRKKRTRGTTSHRISTALHLAVRNGHEEIVLLLLKHGADPETVEKDEEFHEINSYGGVTVTRQRTALHIAVNSNQKGITQLLLNNRANIEAFEEQKESQASLYGSHCSQTERWTALHAAKSKGSDITQLLLQHNAKTIPSSEGPARTPYEIEIDGSEWSRRDYGIFPKFERGGDSID
jgi:ankyrin repeat protein